MAGELARRSSFKIPDARVRIIMGFRRVVPYAEAIEAQRYKIDFPKVVYSRKVHFTDCSNCEESVDASVTHFTAQAGVAPFVSNTAPNRIQSSALAAASRCLQMTAGGPCGVEALRGVRPASQPRRE